MTGPIAPFEKIKVTITFDPVSSAIDIEGPDLLQARAMYDFLFREIDRMTMLQFVEKARGARVVPAGVLELPHVGD